MTDSALLASSEMKLIVTFCGRQYTVAEKTESYTWFPNLVVTMLGFAKCRDRKESLDDLLDHVEALCDEIIDVQDPQSRWGFNSLLIKHKIKNLKEGMRYD